MISDVRDAFNIYFDIKMWVAKGGNSGKRYLLGHMANLFLVFLFIEMST